MAEQYTGVRAFAAGTAVPFGLAVAWLLAVAGYLLAGRLPGGADAAAVAAGAWLVLGAGLAVGALVRAARSRGDLGTVVWWVAVVHGVLRAGQVVAAIAVLAATAVAGWLLATVPAVAGVDGGPAIGPLAVCLVAGGLLVVAVVLEAAVERLPVG